MYKSVKHHFSSCLVSLQQHTFFCAVGLLHPWSEATLPVSRTAGRQSWGKSMQVLPTHQEALLPLTQLAANCSVFLKWWLELDQQMQPSILSIFLVGMPCSYNSHALIKPVGSIPGFVNHISNRKGPTGIIQPNSLLLIGLPNTKMYDSILQTLFELCQA